MTIKEASLWATNHLKKTVSTANISYLIQYGRVKKVSQNGTTFIPLMELYNYYQSYNGSREVAFKERLGDDLNWALSFEQYKEAETTKHVHRLHPYKGKFIPQLVEYFLDSHTDKFKKETYSKDIVQRLLKFNSLRIQAYQFCITGDSRNVDRRLYAA